MIKNKKLLLLFFISLISMGIFNLSITPIYEGFDENAHYSSIRQIAYSGELPFHGKSFLDESIANYQGPRAYKSGEPPYNAYSGDISYSNFFLNKSMTDSYKFKYRNNIAASEFNPSSVPNWESQHPPLYYIIMTPILHLVSFQPIVTQVFFLRLASFFLVITGIFFAILGAIKVHEKRASGETKANFMLLGFYVYPIMLPMFYPQFARIGNDSLCILIVGLLFYFLAKLNTHNFFSKDAIATGLLLGLGLLTKAFFLPISAAIYFFFILNIFKSSLPLSKRSLIKYVLLVITISISIGSIWYLYNYYSYNSISGANITHQLQYSNVIGSIAKNFSVITFLRATGATFVTFVWGGTWSLAHINYWLYIPMLAFLGLIVYFYFLLLHFRPLDSFLWIPVFLLLFFELGLLWHIFINIALGSSGSPNTPGWYLHILLPFFAPAIGIASQAFFNSHKLRNFFFFLVAYAVTFYLIATYLQVALFTGLAIKGEDKHYLFGLEFYSADFLIQIYERLNVIAFPNLGILSFFVWGFSIYFLLRELMINYKTKDYLR